MRKQIHIKQSLIAKSIGLLLGTSVLTVTAPVIAQQVSDDTEVIQISGIRGGLLRAIDQKRDAANVMDAISAEDIGDFPDQNIAESLTRIPGVSISRSRGEGNGVTVRGFGPQFNNVSLNNRTMATVRAGREFDFQVIPSELIQDAHVVKTPTAEMTEGSIGASINLITANPLDLPEQTLTGSITAFNSQLAGKTGTKLSGLYSNVFNDGKLGFLVGVSFDDRETRTDTSRANGGWQSQNMTLPNPNAPGETITVGTRIDKFHQNRLDLDNNKRAALTTTVQYRPNENWDLKADVFYTSHDVNNDSYVNVNAAHIGRFENVVLDEHNTALKYDKVGSPLSVSSNDESRATETLLVGLNAAWEKDDIEMEFDLAWSEAESIGDQRLVSVGTPPADTSYTFDHLNKDAPDFIVNSDTSLTNLSDFRGHFATFSANEITDEVLDAKLNFTWHGDSGALKAGLAYQDRTKEFLQIETPSKPVNVKCSFCGRKQELLGEGIAVDFPVEDFLKDLNGNFPRDFLAINPQALLAFYDTIKPGVAEQFSPVLDPVGSSLVDESTLSGYVQAEFMGDIGNLPFSGNAGLRIVQTKQTSAGYGQDIESVVKTVPDDPTDPNLTINFTPQQAVEVNNQYTDVLPSLNLTFELQDDLILRYAAAKVITRPTLSEIATRRNFSANGQNYNTSGGNPLLTPFEADQQDITLEWYASEDMSLALAIFRKDIKTFIAEETRPLVVPGPTGDLVFDNTSPQNVAGGEISGFEIAYTHVFSELPDMLDGLGMQANYTFATSSDSRADNESIPVNSVAPSSALEGFAKNTYNLIAFYENSGFSARLAYNLRDNFLATRKGRAGLPENVESYGQLDFSLGYEINDNISVHLEGINATNERNVRYADIRARVLDVEFSGQRYMFTVRGKM
ncbi:TonB-dependent receptor [Paraglaciecola sp.]|uniref:TonB-dependent receptor n=1 Tax=Paraglaciecola sp. TaxID=1920173 RepID=UPI003EF7FB03